MGWKVIDGYKAGMLTQADPFYPVELADELRDGKMVFVNPEQSVEIETDVLPWIDELRAKMSEGYELSAASSASGKVLITLTRDTGDEVFFDYWLWEPSSLMLWIGGGLALGAAGLLLWATLQGPRR